MTEMSDQHDGKRVLVIDPHCVRRQRITRRTAGLDVQEAASLCEAFPLAEQGAPQIVAISGDLGTEPEVEGLLRLADMLGSQVFFYSAAGQPAKRVTAARDRPAVPVQDGDMLADLLARLADPNSHRQPSGSDARMPDLVLIGASTGGIDALEWVLSSFPADCPPTLVVQHIRDGFVTGLVRRLDSSIRPRVTEAEDGERLQRGTVYFAPDSGRHLAVAGQAVPRCALIRAEPRNGHRPSVDLLFESALPVARSVSAALLTGMGADGAAGLGGLRRAGAHTIAQDRETSVVWGMPRVAVESGAAAEVLPLDRIGPALLLGRVATTGAGR